MYVGEYGVRYNQPYGNARGGDHLGDCQGDLLLQLGDWEVILGGSYSSSPPLSPFSLYWCTVPALKPRPVRSAERIGLTTTSPCSSLDYSVESSKKKIKK